MNTNEKLIWKYTSTDKNKTNNIIKDKNSHYIMVKGGSNHSENTIYLTCMPLIQ